VDDIVLVLWLSKLLLLLWLNRLLLLWFNRLLLWLDRLQMLWLNKLLLLAWGTVRCQLPDREPRY
jgi:hypothetical protein